MRILSLLASATEIVCALGFESHLVGRSHECDFPASVLSLPQISFPKFVLDGRSYEIDQRVKALLSEGLSLYRIDVEQLKELKPDLILTQVQCEVCAVSLHDLEAVLGDFMGYSPQVVALNPNSLSDIYEDISRIASALNVAERGEALVRSLVEDFQQVQKRIKAGSKRRPRVLTLEWLDPLMSGGNWLPELLHYVEAENLSGEAGKHSPWISFQEIEALCPEVLLLLPCGFDISRTKSELPQFFLKHPWQQLPAVRAGEVYVLDGNQYFNRSGPRIRESVFILEEILHPGIRAPRFEGSGWEKYLF